MNPGGGPVYIMADEAYHRSSTLHCIKCRPRISRLCINHQGAKCARVDLANVERYQGTPFENETVLYVTSRVPTIDSQKLWQRARPYFTSIEDWYRLIERNRITPWMLFRQEKMACALRALRSVLELPEEVLELILQFAFPFDQRHAAPKLL